MRIAFTIPRKPVGVNDAYRRAAFSDRRGAHGGSGMIMTREGKEFVAAARMYALVAARAARWPTNLATVERVAIEVRAFNSDLDVDSPLKLTLDAFEGVLYGKDKVVRRLFVEPDDDGGVHAVAIVNADGSIRRMLTQADVVRFLAAHVDELGPLATATVRGAAGRGGCGATGGRPWH